MRVALILACLLVCWSVFSQTIELGVGAEGNWWIQNRNYPDSTEQKGINRTKAANSFAFNLKFKFRYKNLWPQVGYTAVLMQAPKILLQDDQHEKYVRYYLPNDYWLTHIMELGAGYTIAENKKWRFDYYLGANTFLTKSGHPNEDEFKNRFGYQVAFLLNRRWTENLNVGANIHYRNLLFKEQGSDHTINALGLFFTLSRKLCRS